MAYDDFVKNFTTLEMCMSVPPHDVEDQKKRHKRKWELTTHEGSWKKHINAGGCRNHLGEWERVLYICTRVIMLVIFLDWIAFM